MPAYELVEWNGPTGEEYAVFEVDENGWWLTDSPVSTGTRESEEAFIARMAEPCGIACGREKLHYGRCARHWREWGV